MGKLVYKPVGLVLGAAAGAMAGFVFKRVWRAVADEDDAPSATDERSTWTEVLAAAALQGLIFAVVKAAVDRGGAAGYRRLTGSWPG
jgi:Protein of unknown function (DUF4235)